MYTLAALIEGLFYINVYLISFLFLLLLNFISGFGIPDKNIENYLVEIFKRNLKYLKLSVDIYYMQTLRINLDKFLSFKILSHCIGYIYRHQLKSLARFSEIAIFRVINTFS